MTARLGPRRIRARAFIRNTRAGATAIASAVVAVMTLAGTALMTDHVWLYDQRDVLKTAAEAAAIAATFDIDRQLATDPTMSDDDLKTALEPVATRYVLANLAHLPSARYAEAKRTLDIEFDLDRAQRTVGVTAKADLGGTLISRGLLGYEGPDKVAASAGVESESTPVEVVLAIDVSYSMKLNLSGSVWSHPGPGSRMNIVKGAAKSLVTILGPSAYNRVAIGIVPWHLTVRLDDGDASEWARKGWADYPAKRTYPVPYYCRANGCDDADAVVDTLPVTVPGAWKGCFDGHRIDGGTSKVPAPTTTALFEPPSTTPFAQSYFQPQYGTSYACPDPSTLPSVAISLCYESQPSRHQQRYCTGSRLLPLHTVAADIEDAIDSLAPAVRSLTFSTLGVLWAQRMLEPTWKSVWGGAVHPADPKTPGHADLRKAIVLLTDGQDSYCEPRQASSYNEDCSGTTLAVSRTEACAQAKAQGTEIFVIAAMPASLISDTTGETLRKCSSENDKEYPQGTRRAGMTYVFLDNATPAALRAAFTNIANQLRTLRKVL